MQWISIRCQLLEELQALGIAFVSLNEGIDATTPAGRLQMHLLGAIAAFERARIAERAYYSEIRSIRMVSGRRLFLSVTIPILPMF